MRTVVLDEPRRLRLTETTEPTDPPPGQALVRVRRIGVCGTDLHAFRGEQPFFSYPRILGHELGVEVVAINTDASDADASATDQPGLAVGDRCAVEPYLNCGQCVACRCGRTNCCDDLKVLGVHVDGGMRDTICVPIDKLHKSAALSLEQLALVETLGIGAHAVSRGRPHPGEHVLVVGAGPIGLSVMQFAQLQGADVAVMDVSETRLAFCRDALGIQRTTLAGGDAAQHVVAVRAMFDGALPTLVFDATGNARAMNASFDLLPSTGRIVLVGIVPGDITFDDPQFHRRELTVMATRNSTGDDFRRIISLIETGRIDTTPWITHRAALAAVPEQFAGWLDPANKVIKAMVVVE